MDEIVAFLRAYPPFDHLPLEAVELAAEHIQIEYFPAGHDILTFGGPPAEFLYIVRKGVVDFIREEDGDVVIFDSLGPGEAFGYPSLIRRRPPIVTVRTHTEVLAYLLPAAIFYRLHDEYPAFASYFAASALHRLTFAARSRYEAAEPSLFQTSLYELISRPLIAIGPDATVREAAQMMHDRNVSCLLVDLPPYRIGPQTGIITDRDLRNRVLAAGLPYSTPLREVMTTPVVSLPASAMAFEAMLLMLERHIHHLPVTENDRVIGMVTHTDILRRQSNNPLFLPRQLQRAHSLEDLRRYGEQVTAAVGAMLDSGVRVSDIGRIVAVAHDALIQRLLQDAEAELGAPPAPYAWLVLGSEGRYEQTLRTDQDNALVYADDHPPDAPEYFRILAERVVERLVFCGFPRCPGNVMATNPQWRQPLSVWQATFAHWIEAPDEEALLRSSIFFDYRQIYGKLDAESALRPIIARARHNRVFLGRLARAALRNPAPLNIFRNVVLERRGDRKNLIDLKMRGTAMVVDLARLFALEAGCPDTSTVVRLRRSWPEATIGEKEAESLISAFELLSLLRLRHQRAQLQRGETPTNLIVYTDLSPLEQRELKESLQAIARVQRGLAIEYQTGRIA